METTRHFTATTYVVNDGATALHAHERLGSGFRRAGDVDRDELPHEAALREIREETGLEAELVATESSIEGPNTRGLPDRRTSLPRHQRPRGRVGRPPTSTTSTTPGRLSRNRARSGIVDRDHRRRLALVHRRGTGRATSSGT